MTKAFNQADVFIKKFTLGPLMSNSYILASKKTKDACLIDPCKPTKAIIEVISDSNLRLRCIINTHGHIDHIQGNGDFDVPVYIHKDDASFLEDPVKNLSHYLGGWHSPKNKALKLLKDGDVIKVGQIDLRVIHTPGHTPGSICLQHMNLLFTGDTLFFDSVGRYDLAYASESKLKKSIKKRLLVLPDETIVYPGHGPRTSIGRERSHNPFL